MISFNEEGNAAQISLERAVMITSIKIPSQLQLILLMTRRKGAEARRNYAAFKRIEIKHSILAGTHFPASACSASQMCKSQGRKCD